MTELKMTELKMEHVLMVAIVVFIIYHFIGRCRCNSFKKNLIEGFWTDEDGEFSNEDGRIQAYKYCVEPSDTMSCRGVDGLCWFTRETCEIDNAGCGHECQEASFEAPDGSKAFINLPTVEEPSQNSISDTLDTWARVESRKPTNCKGPFC